MPYKPFTHNWVRAAFTVRPDVNKALGDLCMHYGLTRGQLVNKLVSEEIAKLGKQGVVIGE